MCFVCIHMYGISVNSLSTLSIPPSSCRPLQAGAAAAAAVGQFNCLTASCVALLTP